MTVSAHFDGKVVVPDEPRNLPANQALIVQIEPVDDSDNGEESVLTWLVANALDNDSLPIDLAAELDHYLYGCPKKAS